MISYFKQFQRLEIQLDSIKSATNNFSDQNLIGKGGFGEVYKGELAESGHTTTTTVAVKRLRRAFGQGDVEFQKEVMMLSLHEHDNIISLLGYHNGNDEKILVYEYAANRSLDLHLENHDLTWARRLEICIGAARGLEHLHSPTTNHQRILHRDIKSSNILLDENWNAKISDFGLSKYGPANQEYTFVLSNAVGTFGYCDPLYAETGFLTKESDVYSFGVVLFEVLCGRLNNKQNHTPLIGLVPKHYESGNLMEIVFDKIKDEIHPDSFKAYTKIAYRCLKRDREERPSMNEVVRALEIALGNQRDSRGPMTTPSINEDWNIKKYYKPTDEGGSHDCNAGPSSYGTGGRKGADSISVSDGSDIQSEQDEPRHSVLEDDVRSHIRWRREQKLTYKDGWGTSLIKRVLGWTKSKTVRMEDSKPTISYTVDRAVTDEDERTEWTAQVEPGVRVTFVSLANGGNDLKRVRFNREMFDKWEAQMWWGENRHRITELYNVRRKSTASLRDIGNNV